MCSFKNTCKTLIFVCIKNWTFNDVMFGMIIYQIFREGFLFLNGKSEVPICCLDLIFQCLAISLKFEKVGLSHVIDFQNHVWKITGFLIFRISLLELKKRKLKNWKMFFKKANHLIFYNLFDKFLCINIKC